MYLASATRDKLMTKKYSYRNRKGKRRKNPNKWIQRPHYKTIDFVHL